MGVLFLVMMLASAFPVPVAPLAVPAPSVDRFTLPGLAAAIPTVVPHESPMARAMPLTVFAPHPAEDGDETDATVDERVHTSFALHASHMTLRGEPDPAVSASAARPMVGPAAPDDPPIFFEYEVQPGETLTAVAERFNVSVDYVLWNNLDISDPNAVLSGQVLQIPSVEGIIHSVRATETVSEIAARYDADWRDVIQFQANGLSTDPNLIAPGSLILVPGGVVKPQPAEPLARPGTADGSAVASWGWPTNGRLTSPYGPTHPLGIDLAAPLGTPIYASMAGTVTFAAGDPCCSYGYHVMVADENGYETLYAHLDGFAVSAGDTVQVGDVIGYIGLTGLTTGPHVHFEIRRKGAYMDPVAFLP